MGVPAHMPMSMSQGMPVKRGNYSVQRKLSLLAVAADAEYSLHARCAVEVDRCLQSGNPWYESSTCWTRMPYIG